MNVAWILIPWSIASFSLAKPITVSNSAELVEACKNAAKDDEIVIAKGTYTLVRGISITSRSGPITVRGATGNPSDVIIEGEGQDDDTVKMIFDLTDCPAWKFEAFTTRKSYYHGFKFNAGSTDCVLRNLVMLDHGESGVKGTSDPDRGSYPDRLLVEKCEIGFTAKTGGTRDVVEGVDGVGVKDWIVRGSRFVNIQKNGRPAYGVFTKGNSSNTLIEDNRFENCFIGASFGGGGTGVAYFRDHDTSIEHRGGIIRKNRFIGCTDAAIYINKGKDCRIEGNRLEGCAANIQLRYAQCTGHVSDNQSDNTSEPLVRLREGAVLLKE